MSEFKIEYKYLNDTYTFREPRIPRADNVVPESDLQLLERYGISREEVLAKADKDYEEYRQKIRARERRRQALETKFVSDLADFLGEPLELVQKVYDYVDREHDPESFVAHAHEVDAITDLIREVQPLL